MNKTWRFSTEPGLYLFLLMTCLTIFTGLTSAQKLFLTPTDHFREANGYMVSLEPQEAMPIYQQLRVKGLTSASLDYRIGKCYLQMPGQKERSVPFLEAASKKVERNYLGLEPDEEAAPFETWFLLVQAYRIVGRFVDCQALIERLLTTAELTEVEGRMLLHERELTNNATAMLASPGKVSNELLGPPVNNNFSSTNPVATRDGGLLFYMSRLKFYDAPMVTKREEHSWGTPENLSPTIKSDGDYLITSISAHGKTLLLFNYDLYNNGDIYSTTLTDNGWTPITRLNENINTPFNETHASFSADGKTLFFTSNRPGGYGGLDIYRSQMDGSGDWGPAENLGPVINTPYNEETPFETPEGNRLFFSSQGHYNMGGYDILYADRAPDGSYQPPVNPGFPLNTADDDLFYFPLGKGYEAYQARLDNNHSGQFGINKVTLHAMARPFRFMISGRVEVPEEAGTSPANIRVAFFDNELADTLAVTYTNNQGEYRQSLPSGDFLVSFGQKGKPFGTETLRIPENFAISELIVTTNLTPVVATTTDTLVIFPLYFGFDSYRLSATELKKLSPLTDFLTTYPNITITLEGHTDAIGNPKYNQLLSERRVKWAADMLIRQGIDKNRITIKGFGQESPVSLNRTAEGKDSSEGRRYNRRVEIKAVNPYTGLILVNENPVPEGLRVGE